MIADIALSHSGYWRARLTLSDGAILSADRRFGSWQATVGERRRDLLPALCADLQTLVKNEEKSGMPEPIRQLGNKADERRVAIESDPTPRNRVPMAPDDYPLPAPVVRPIMERMLGRETLSLEERALAAEYRKDYPGSSLAEAVAFVVSLRADRRVAP